MGRWTTGTLTGLLAFLLPAGNLAAKPEALSARGVTALGYIDIAGGGMVDAKGGLAAVGHMAPPFATSLLDVTDPSQPRIISRIRARPGTHSHKARICGNLLVINVERYGGSRDTAAGMALYDISDPRNPREAAFYEMGGLGSSGSGMHRFQFDCGRKLVYAGGSAEGFAGSITLILDVSDAGRPREIGRWWLEGQHVAAGEKSSRQWRSFRTHHPLRMSDRLYVSLWHDGLAILDIADLSRPRLVRHLDFPDTTGAPAHTALPVGHRIQGRDWLVLFEEEMGGGDPRALVRFFDITDEKEPVQAAAFQLPRSDSAGRGCRFGPHQPHEEVGPDNLLYAAWFAGGLRVIDISKPGRPAEVGHYIPAPADPGGCPQSNDVFVDEDGLIYLIDRVRGLHLLRFERDPRE